MFSGSAVGQSVRVGLGYPDIHRGYRRCVAWALRQRAWAVKAGNARNAYKIKDKRAPFTRGGAVAIMAPPLLIGGEKTPRPAPKSWKRSNVCSFIASQRRYRIPHTHRYELTERSLRVAMFLCRTYARLLRAASNSSQHDLIEHVQIF